MDRVFKLLMIGAGLLGGGAVVFGIDARFGGDGERLPPGFGRVHGHVRVNGAPAPGCAVSMLRGSEHGPSPSAVVASDGAFDFGRVALGEVSLTVSPPDASPAFAQRGPCVVRRDGDLDVDLSFDVGAVGGTLTGVLGDLASLWVVVGNRWCHPDAHGVFRCDWVEVGPESIDVRRRDDSAWNPQSVIDQPVPVDVARGLDVCVDRPIEVLPLVTGRGRIEWPASVDRVGLTRTGFDFYREHRDGAGFVRRALVFDDLSFSVELVPGVYTVGCGMSGDPLVEADPITVPREGLEDFVIRVRATTH